MLYIHTKFEVYLILSTTFVIYFRGPLLNRYYLVFLAPNNRVCKFVKYCIVLCVMLGEITTKSAAILDYEILRTFTLEVTASDGTLQDVRNLTIHIDNVNETPVITAAIKAGDVLESENTSRVAIDMDASDPDGDVLNYEITGSNPSGAPFTIDNGNGKLLRYINTICSFTNLIAIAEP